jgi:Ca2+-binding RTX toxin-like protein
VVGGSGDDYVYAHTGSDRVMGQEGDDLVWGGTYPETATDVLSAGDGEDVVFVDNRTPAREGAGAEKDRYGLATLKVGEIEKAMSSVTLFYWCTKDDVGKCGRQKQLVLTDEEAKSIGV